MLGSRPATVVVALVALALLAGSSLGSPTLADHPEPGETADLVEVAPNGSLIWPHTSREPRFEARTLAINAFVFGDETEIRDGMVGRDDRWAGRANATTGEPPGVALSPWRHAHGATRYTYVVPPGREQGVWLTESYQVYDGTYLGRRYHVRAYASPARAERWTAMQAHAEYWDWFRLRHTVTDTATAVDRLESGFDGDPGVESIDRSRVGNRWMTVVRLGSVLAVLAPLGWRRRPGSEDGSPPALVALAGSILAVHLGVRALGVGLEVHGPPVSPKLYAGALYPVLAGGLPACAYRFGRSLTPETASTLAGSTLGVGFVLEAAWLGVESVPVALVLHRVLLLVALGAVAGGAAKRADGKSNDTLWAGLAGWAVGLVLPLAGIP